MTERNFITPWSRIKAHPRKIGTPSSGGLGFFFTFPAEKSPSEKRRFSFSGKDASRNLMKSDLWLMAFEIRPRGITRRTQHNFVNYTANSTHFGPHYASAYYTWCFRIVSTVSVDESIRWSVAVKCFSYTYTVIVERFDFFML